jgi:glutathione S-transferase
MLMAISRAIWNSPYLYHTPHWFCRGAARESAYLRQPDFPLLCRRGCVDDREDDVAGLDTVFRMIKVKGGYRYAEDAQRSPANPHPSPEQLLPNEYVERSRRMHGNDVENIPLFLVSGLLYVCTAPSSVTAFCVFTIYVLSRFAHFYVVLTARPHEVRAMLWTVGSVAIYFMAGTVLWTALRS